MKIIKIGGGRRLGVCVRAVEEWAKGGDAPCDTLIILPIPTTRDGLTVNGTGATMNEISGLARGGVAIAGYGIPSSVRKRAEELGAMVYDASLDEDFLLENARITAHGALGRILTEAERDLSDLSIGVIGYGRIGSALSELLLFLGASVRIFSGSEEKIMALASLGADVRSLDDGDFYGLDILVNTAPQRLISVAAEKELLGRGVRIIELASGKNFSSDEVCVMSSIPDKMYPISSGRMYAKHIIKSLSR